MTAAFLVTLRETLEASLLIGVVLSQLHMTNNRQYNYFVWLGLMLGILLSIIFALVFQLVFGGFSGGVHEVYEGVFMILGACFVTWMMWWLHRNSQSQAHKIRKKVNDHVGKHYPLGILMLVLLAVAREGIETVIFLQATMFMAQDVWHSTGALLGIAIAIVLAYLLFKSIISLSLQVFFRTVHIILLFFAAGLVAHGVHELQEAALLPVFNQQIWDANRWLDESGMLGSLAKALFGYNANPSLLEVVSYVAYVLGISGVWYYVSRTSKSMV